jgi:hypothetical protein
LARGGRGFSARGALGFGDGIGSGTSRAIGGASRTGLVSISPMVSPSAVISARERANPGGLRFAGRRRNMLSKSTIPALLKPFTVSPRPAAAIRFAGVNMNDWMSLAQRNNLDLRGASRRRPVA